MFGTIGANNQKLVKYNDIILLYLLNTYSYAYAKIMSYNKSEICNYFIDKWLKNAVNRLLHLKIRFVFIQLISKINKNLIKQSSSKNKWWNQIQSQQLGFLSQIFSYSYANKMGEKIWFFFNVYLLI